MRQEKTKILSRAFILFFLGCQLSSSLGQIDGDALNGEWIAIGCRFIPSSNQNVSIEGHILSFDDPLAESYFFWKDSLIQFNYKQRDSLIIYNDTVTFGKIQHLGTDSLVLHTNNNRITTYLPVHGNRNVLSKSQLDSLLTKKSWTKNYWDGEFTMDFIDHNASPYIKYFNGIIDNKYSLGYESGYWSSFAHNGYLFLRISLLSDEYYETGFFQIMKLDSSVIHSKYLSQLPPDTSTFRAIENLSDKDYARLTNILTSKDWSVKSIQETYKYYGLGTRFPDEELIPINRYGKGDMLKEDFLSGNTKYSFSDSTFSISSNSSFVLDGRWFLSRNGKYLYLSNQYMGSRINKILEFDENKITIRQIIALKVSKRSDEIEVYDYIIELN